MKVDEIHRLLVSQMKSLSYEEIKVMPDHQNYELPEGYDDFEMTITKTLNQDNSISVLVKFTDYTDYTELLLPLPSKIEGYDVEKYVMHISYAEKYVKYVSSGMADGFDIFPDGKIVDMHGEYDDDGECYDYDD